jgi:hypothetical protein
MARVVKDTGQHASKARGRTSHGSPNEAEWNRIQGRQDNRDKRPNGFLSRHTKPANGRKRGGPA